MTIPQRTATPVNVSVPGLKKISAQELTDKLWYPELNFPKEIQCHRPPENPGDAKRQYIEFQHPFNRLIFYTVLQALVITLSL